MKKSINSIMLLFILSASFICLSSQLHAQGWSWGRGGSGGTIDSWPIACDPSGNIYAGGLATNRTTPIDFGYGVALPPYPSTAYYQTMWIKYNSAGVPLWAGCTSSGTTFLYNICSDPGGNLILFGSFTSATMTLGSFTLTNSYGGSAAQYFLVKIDPTGTILWAIADGNINPSYYSILTALICSAGGVTTDEAGNIYITSSFIKPTMTIGSTTLTNTDASGSSYDIFVAKYSPAGVPLWATSVGGPRNDYGFGITVASTGFVYVTGVYYSASFNIGSGTLTNPGTNPYAYIGKFTSAGTPNWGQGEGGTLGAFGVGLAHDNYGNVYMTGGFADATISFGATTVTRTLGTAGVDALYLVQYSPTNVVTWSKSISSSVNCWGFCIAMASCGQVWVSGNYRANADIDGHILAVPPGTPPDPVFIAGYNLTGGVVGYGGLASGGDDQNGIACDGSGNVFINSDFQGTSLVVGSDTVRTTGGGSEYFYIAKYANSIIAPDTVHFRHDTSACGIDSILLKGRAGYTNYYWDNTSTDSTRWVYTTGTYFVFNIRCGDTVIVDTFHVSFLPSDTTKYRHDTSVCVAIGSATLSAPAGYTTYRWNTGSPASSIVVSATGTYWVNSITGCILKVDTFHFTIVPDDTTFYAHDTSLCASAGSLSLIAHAGSLSWLWSTGSTAPSILVSASGGYTVFGSNVCHIIKDTFHVTFKPVPVVNLGLDTAFCIGNTITLSSTQPPGFTYLWSTGSTGSSISVSTSGTYSLTVTGTNGCTTTDAKVVTVSPIPIVDLGPDTAICNGVTPLLQSIYTYPAGSTYLWNTGGTTASIIAPAVGTYWLQVTVVGCSATDTIKVTNLYDTLNFPMKDTAICRGGTVAVRAAGTPGMTYQWMPTAGIAISTMLNPAITPDTSAMYYIRASISTCSDIVDSFYIDVQPVPQVFAGGNRSVCQWDTLHLHTSVIPAWYQHYSYSWSPATYLDDPTQPDVVFTGQTNTKYIVTVTTPAGCTGIDSASIIVHPGNFATLGTTYNLCPHDSAQLKPTGGVSYQWHPGLYLTDSLTSAPWVHAITSQGYTVIATDAFGCHDTVFTNVVIRPSAVIFIEDSARIYPGESYQINPQTNCTYFTWFPPAGLSYYHISNPLASPEVSTKYIVHGTTEFGCQAVDSINIYVDNTTLLNIPNAFTPGSGINNKLYILRRGEAVLHYFRIFDRWGNKVFETTNIDEGWDGTFHGAPQPYDVYVYQVEAVSNSTGQIFKKTGNVTLIR